MFDVIEMMRRVLEVDRVAEAVCKLAVFKNLQQDVETTSGCAFSISSSSTTEYGARFTRVVSWPPSS